MAPRAKKPADDSPANIDAVIVSMRDRVDEVAEDNKRLRAEVSELRARGAAPVAPPPPADKPTPAPAPQRGWLEQLWHDAWEA